MDCNFFVGQRVVCVDDFARVSHLPYANLAGLRLGEVYTIRWIGLHPWHPNPRAANTPCLRLEEISRPVRPPDKEEVGFSHKCFRPATDISELEALLNTTEHTTETPQHEHT